MFSTIPKRRFHFLSYPQALEAINALWANQDGCNKEHTSLDTTSRGLETVVTVSDISIRHEIEVLEFFLHNFKGTFYIEQDAIRSVPQGCVDLQG
jgi:hypothetical protein